MLKLPPRASDDFSEAVARNTQVVDRLPDNPEEVSIDLLEGQTFSIQADRGYQLQLKAWRESEMAKAEMLKCSAENVAH